MATTLYIHVRRGHVRGQGTIVSSGIVKIGTKENARERGRWREKKRIQGDRKRRKKMQGGKECRERERERK